MADKKAVWIQWLTIFGSMVGAPCPEDTSDESLRRFYHHLCFLFHPDKQSHCPDKRHKDRLIQMFQILSGVHDKYTKGKPEEVFEKPNAASFQDEEVKHDRDTAPERSRSKHAGRRVYLVTFSHTQGEGRRAPSDFTRKEFAALLVKAFEASVPRLRVEYLAVFQELHAAGKTEEERKVHFHAAVKSSLQHQWSPVAEYLRRGHVYVHFAVSGEGYWQAFRYGWWPTKHKPLPELDKEYELVDGTEAHPPPAEAAKAPFWEGRKHKRGEEEQDEASTSDGEEAKERGMKEEEAEEAEEAPKNRREPQNAYAFRLIRDHNLCTGDAFLSFVQRLQDPRLISLCMQRSASSIVERALHVIEADARLKRKELGRIEILRLMAENQCTCDRHWDWKNMALELLQFQKIHPAQFAKAMITALETGASKGANIFIHGTTTSAKSWILDPLRVIYRCHLTPPRKSSFPLQDLPLKEVILWQDFRLDEDVLPWASLLLLFEGTEVSIRRPRTEFQSDLDYKVSQPVFLTSVAPLRNYDSEEQAMMNRRFIFFHFEKTVPTKQMRKIPPCGPCFGSLWLSLTTPNPDAPLLCSEEGQAGGSSQVTLSQGVASSEAELPRSASSCSSGLPFCGECGLPLSSSPYCRANGSKHA